jgi:hypothetical protein
MVALKKQKSGTRNQFENENVKILIFAPTIRQMFFSDRILNFSLFTILWGF